MKGDRAPRHTSVPDDVVGRQRHALRQVIDQLDFTAAEWARKAGLPNANSIYNFLAGASRSLHPRTIEKLAEALPGMTVGQLLGEAKLVPPTRTMTIVV